MCSSVRRTPLLRPRSRSPSLPTSTTRGHKSFTVLIGVVMSMKASREHTQRSIGGCISLSPLRPLVSLSWTFLQRTHGSCRRLVGVMRRMLLSLLSSLTRSVISLGPWHLCVTSSSTRWASRDHHSAISLRPFLNQYQPNERVPSYEPQTPIERIKLLSEN